MGTRRLMAAACPLPQSGRRDIVGHVVLSVLGFFLPFLERYSVRPGSEPDCCATSCYLWPEAALLERAGGFPARPPRPSASRSATWHGPGFGSPEQSYRLRLATRWIPSNLDQRP